MKKLFFLGVMVLLVAGAFAFNQSGEYHIVNKSGLNVVSISYCKSGDNFSNSTTVSGSIAKDQNTTVDLSINTEVCSYDIKFTDDKGVEYVMSGVDLCTSKTIVLDTGDKRADEVPQFKLR